MSQYSKWYHPYQYEARFKKKVAYFSMEFAIDQALKIYSGGLGFLAGSHMRSAYELKQNLIGIGILWKYGYYDQTRNMDQSLGVQWTEKNYSFLEDTGILVDVPIFDNRGVKARAFALKADTFGSAPLYLLSTDIPENDYLSRTITHRLYEDNVLTRLAQSMVLGVGGLKVVEALGGADIYHLNEGHGLPAFTHLYAAASDKKKLREQCVFTTHTPEKAGNEEHDLEVLKNIGFFPVPSDGTPGWSDREIDWLTDRSGRVNYTVAALRMAKKANAVSKIHASVSKEMWGGFKDICSITPITNAQNFSYWSDKDLRKALEKDDDMALITRKRAMKSALFEIVADQCGKLFDPNILTLVWARRFAEYKRADLLLKDFERFRKLVTNEERPVQIIWAGKPYPKDHRAIGTFNSLVRTSKEFANCAVLTGYELSLSRHLKAGSDVWLNTPRKPREASGTSGMTAAMNGSVNLSIKDGWIPEFGKHGVNSFLIPDGSDLNNQSKLDREDFNNLYKIIETEILPAYYDHPAKWMEIVKSSMRDVTPAFSSHRMAEEYYEKLYQ